MDLPYIGDGPAALGASGAARVGPLLCSDLALSRAERGHAHRSCLARRAAAGALPLTLTLTSGPNPSPNKGFLLP
eukprot:scaffold56301_cov35-Phaeocystis_antarctica.AAC.1